MKKILAIISFASLLLSCNQEEKYARLAEEFLKEIPPEKIIASFTDANRHCIFYIEEEAFKKGKEFLGIDVEGEKCHNIIKYDLKTKEHSKILRDDNMELKAGLEDGVEFIMIDHFETNNSSILISSWICYGRKLFSPHSYYELALYNIDENKWHYLKGFPSPEFQMTEERVRCCSEDFSFIGKDFFGELEWIKEFDMNGDCIENYVYDKLYHKKYNAEKLIVELDVDYADEVLRENFMMYLENEIISDEKLSSELSANQIACDAKYKGQYILFKIGSIDKIRHGTEYGYVYHIKSFPDFPYELNCFSNDPGIGKWSSGESCILRGKYEESDRYCIYMTDCRTLDTELLAQVFQSQYLQYIANQREQ